MDNQHDEKLQQEIFEAGKESFGDNADAQLYQKLKEVLNKQNNFVATNPFFPKKAAAQFMKHRNKIEQRRQIALLLSVVLICCTIFSTLLFIFKVDLENLLSIPFGILLYVGFLILIAKLFEKKPLNI